MISRYDNLHGDEGYEWEICSSYYRHYNVEYDDTEYDDTHNIDDECAED